MIFSRLLPAGLVSAALLASPACAQLLPHPDETLAISHGAAAGSLELRWFGHAGRAYFLQYSPTLETGSWIFLPVVEPGADAPLAYGASAPGENGRFFARTVVQASASAVPAREDFDADKLSSMDEIQTGLNPLGSADSDFDGLPDDWERFHFGGLSRDGSGDYDGDGLTDAQEYAAGRHPDTEIVYAGMRFRWAAERNGKVYFRNHDDTNVLVVVYADAAQTRVQSINIHLDLPYDDLVGMPAEPEPLAEYTRGDDTEGAHTLVFTAHQLVQTYPANDDSDGETISRSGRDLLRQIDGRPYRRVAASGSSPAKRVAAYRAITSIPATALVAGGAPIVVRDMPYQDEPNYPDFGFEQHVSNGPGLVLDSLDPDGLPRLAWNDIDPTRSIESPATFDTWYHDPALSYVWKRVPGRELSLGENFPEDAQTIFNDEQFFPHRSDTDREFGRFGYTMEYHGRLAYDLASTRFAFRADDDFWVFINGKLVLDWGGIGQKGPSYPHLADLPHNLTKPTGIVDIDIFYAERQRSFGVLLFKSTSPVTPVYTYQIVAEGLPAAASSCSYELLGEPPVGMTVDAKGKLRWDYAAAAPGAYLVEVRVTDALLNTDTQSFTLTLSSP